MNVAFEKLLKGLIDLDQRLVREGIFAELCLVAGQVMTLAFRQRSARGTDDRIPESGSSIRIHALYVETTQMLPKDWLTQAVEQYLATKPSVSRPEAEHLPRFVHLSIGNRQAAYVLAMKCKVAGGSSTLGRAEMEEIRFLLHYLRLRTPSEVFNVIGRYYPPEEISPSVQYVIENSLVGEGAENPPTA